MDEIKLAPENTNLGVLITAPKETDYIAGSSPLPIIIVNPSADNRPYKPEQEAQSGSGGDKMDCVTVSGGGCIETNLHRIKATGFSARAQAFFDKWRFNAMLNISTRFAAIQNGTTPEGNYANVVAQWWRDNGFIPEWMLPNDQTLTWAQYYDKSVITDEMRQCAAESKEIFDINYEWVYGVDGAQYAAQDSDRIAALKRGAVQLLTAVCPGWNTQSPVPACHLPVQHAHELLFIEPISIRDIFDSYNPFNKSLSADYVIPYTMLYIVSEKKENPSMQLIKDNGTVYLVSGVNQKVKTGIADMAVESGIFGDEPVTEGDTSAIPETHTISSKGFIINEKAQA